MVRILPKKIDSIDNRKSPPNSDPVRANWLVPSQEADTQRHREMGSSGKEVPCLRDVSVFVFLPHHACSA